MVNYNNSMIYKLCCKDLNIKDFYIGSTTNFKQRKRDHKKRCLDENRYGYKCKVYEFIRNNGGWENWDMILVKNINCNNKLELRQYERKYYEELKPSLNTHKPLRGKKEKKEYEYIWSIKYREKNKELIRMKSKKYYEKNKDKIRMRRKKKVKCICGCVVRNDCLTRHMRNKKHLTLLNKKDD